MNDLSRNITETVILTNSDRVLKIKDVNNDLYFIITDREGELIFPKRYASRQEALNDYHQIYEIKISHCSDICFDLSREFYNNIDIVKKSLSLIYSDIKLRISNNETFVANYMEKKTFWSDEIEILHNGISLNREELAMLI